LDGESRKKAQKNYLERRFVMTFMYEEDRPVLFEGSPQRTSAYRYIFQDSLYCRYE
jgi:hypothetical protein